MPMPEPPRYWPGVGDVSRVPRSNVNDWPSQTSWVSSMQSVVKAFPRAVEPPTRVHCSGSAMTWPIDVPFSQTLTVEYDAELGVSNSRAVIESALAGTADTDNAASASL